MIEQRLESEWSRDYLAFMRCGAGDRWLPEVEQQVGSWLRGKKNLDLDLHHDGEVIDGDRTVSVRRSADGAVRDLRLSLIERNTDKGTWTTELLAHDEPGGEDWIFLQVTNDQGNFVATPWVAKYLMQALPLSDGLINFVDEPQMFRTSDLDRLVALLADERRHGLVFVAGTDDRLSVDAFKQQVGDWALQVYGLAQVVVLDPSATQAFEDRVGKLAAPAWTIRTYQPGVDFADLHDGRRHRILGTERLVRHSDGRIRYLLGDIARSHANERELPKAVQRVRRHFERLENRQLVAALSAPELSDVQHFSVTSEARIEATAEIAVQRRRGGASTSAVQLALVKSFFGLDEITELSLRECAIRIASSAVDGNASSRLEIRINDLQAQLESSEDRNAEILEVLKDEQMSHEITRIDLDRVNGRARWLEGKLRNFGDFEANYLETPQEFIESRPEDFLDLLERIDGLPGVKFTGDPEDALELAAVDTNGAALRTAWDAVLVLDDYTRARRNGEFESGIRQYLGQTPSGYRTFPPGKFAETESAETMRQFGDERLFPVPESYDKRGVAAMKAHFKLASIGMATPRMHILDAHPVESLVYIGYIGRHLTNTKTRSM